MDGISNSTTRVCNRDMDRDKHRAEKGVKIQARTPRVIKHTKLSSAPKEENTSHSELKTAIVETIRDELRAFGGTSSNAVAPDTLYIPKDSGDVETHIQSEVSTEPSTISSALQRLKKLKENK